MRSGLLDRRLALRQDADDTLDQYGVPRDAWSNVQDVRIQLVEHKTDQNTTGGAVATEHGITFRMRYRPGVTTGRRVLFEGSVFEIVAVQEIGRRRALECRAHYRGTP